MMIFSNIKGDAVMSYLRDGKTIKRFATALGGYHKKYLEKSGQLSQFISGDFDRKVLVHPDFQMTNVLLGKSDGIFYMIDFGGLSLGSISNFESLACTYKGSSSPGEIIESYVSSFEQENRASLAAKIMEKIKLRTDCPIQ